LIAVLCNNSLFEKFCLIILRLWSQYFIIYFLFLRPKVTVFLLINFNWTATMVTELNFI